VSRESGIQALREAILAGIEDMKPAAQVPLTTRAWRIYGMLRFRYVEDLPQEVTAEKLGITSRHLRRNFSEAIHALALTMWEKSGGTLLEEAGSRIEPAGNPNSTESASDQPTSSGADDGIDVEVRWHEQLVRELEALEETAAGAVSNVSETVNSVLRLACHLTKKRGIDLVAEPISPRLMAAIHPSALRQILISVIDQMSRQIGAGEIQISANAQNGAEGLNICLSGASLSAMGSLIDFEPVREMLASFNIGIQVNLQESRMQIILSMLQVDRCVLAIDDNMDMAHLFRRYLAGTRYYLQHVNRGEKAFEAINLYHPDLVVLDVMLPDIDGWDLLTRLHENPTTRLLPVMVCSVMREKELAQALGARYFLTKPVQRQDFIQALDTVLQTA
ncbi:MAG TPA: response regulator, partial [Anaerolineales bacterium]